MGSVAYDGVGVVVVVATATVAFRDADRIAIPFLAREASVVEAGLGCCWEYRGLARVPVRPAGLADPGRGYGDMADDDVDEP